MKRSTLKLLYLFIAILALNTNCYSGGQKVSGRDMIENSRETSPSVSRDAIRRYRDLAERIVDIFGLDSKEFEKIDIHLHVPSGAVPKDGPSAGVGMVSSLASLMTGRPASPKVAMTGEITLRGKVLPVGGVKEKVLAAYRFGIREVILPIENEKDLTEIPAQVKRGLTFIQVEHMDEVLKHALERLPRGRTERPMPPSDTPPEAFTRH